MLHWARNSHDPTFRRGITIEHNSSLSRLYRFALYDMDQDEIVTDDELIGEATVDSATLTSGEAVKLPLSKNGSLVPECSIVVNSRSEPTVAEEKQVTAVQPESSVAVSLALKYDLFDAFVLHSFFPLFSNFPILTRGDALITASVKDATTGAWKLVGQTERVG